VFIPEIPGFNLINRFVLPTTPEVEFIHLDSRNVGLLILYQCREPELEVKLLAGTEQ
jgi:hypothetical protein